MKFSMFYEKLMRSTFLIFCLKLQQHTGLKLTQLMFWGKLSFAFLVSRSTRNGPKISFLKFYEKSNHGSFLDLLRELQQHKV